jgi:hypothetical protein
MRHTRFLAIPLVMIFVMACGLSNGIQQLQQAVTKLPGALTSMPTVMGAISTMSAGTPIPGTLGVSLDVTKSVLLASQQLTFTDGTTGGQPESVAKLTNTAAATFPVIAAGFQAEFIGNPASLSKIKVTIPRSEDKKTVDEGVGVLNVIFSGILPPDVQLGLLTWSTQNYANVPVGGQQQTTFGNFQFTLARTQTVMTLDVDPVK